MTKWHETNGVDRLIKIHCIRNEIAIMSVSFCALKNRFSSREVKCGFTKTNVHELGTRNYQKCFSPFFDFHVFNWLRNGRQME